MAERVRLHRRIAGMLRKRLHEARFDALDDPRGRGVHRRDTHGYLGQPPRSRLGLEVVLVLCQLDQPHRIHARRLPGLALQPGWRLRALAHRQQRHRDHPARNHPLPLRHLSRMSERDFSCELCGQRHGQLEPCVFPGHRAGRAFRTNGTADKRSPMATGPGRPLTADEQLGLVNVETSHDPPERVIQAVTRAGDAAELRRLAAGLMRGRPDEGVIRELRCNIRMVTAAETQAVPDRATRSLKPYRPDWSGVMYHSAALRKPAWNPPRERVTLKNYAGNPIDPYWVFNSPTVREPFVPFFYPWTCVGRVEVWTPGIKGALIPFFRQEPIGGTGVLVGDDMVLTAAHCLPWGEEFIVTFTPSYFNGKSFVQPWWWQFNPLAMAPLSDVRGFSCFATHRICYVENRDLAAWDMAVLKLQFPLGTFLGWLAPANYVGALWNDKKILHNVGYPDSMNNAQVPVWQKFRSFTEVVGDYARELRSKDSDISPETRAVLFAPGSLRKRRVSRSRRDHRTCMFSALRWAAIRAVTGH